MGAETSCRSLGVERFIHGTILCRQQLSSATTGTATPSDRSARQTAADILSASSLTGCWARPGKAVAPGHLMGRRLVRMVTSAGCRACKGSTLLSQLLKHACSRELLLNVAPVRTSNRSWPHPIAPGSVWIAPYTSSPSPSRGACIAVSQPRVAERTMAVGTDQHGGGASGTHAESDA